MPSHRSYYNRYRSHNGLWEPRKPEDTIVSHAHGQVRFNSDGKIMFFEYDGTSEWVMNPLYETAKEVHDNWRKVDYPRRCQDKGEEVEIAVSYGAGSYWTGRACRDHKVVTDGFQPYRYYEDNNFGYPNKEIEELRKEKPEYSANRGYPEWWIKNYVTW